MKTATTTGNGQAPPTGAERLSLAPIEKATYAIPIKGETPLIINAWSEKAKQMMRDKQSGKKSRKRLEPKDPETEAEAALHRLENGRPGMPATAFKGAIVGAARLYDGLTMTELKPLIFVRGEGPGQLVPIEGDYVIREDTPRISMGTADLRYRPSFPEWSAVLEVTFIPAKIDLESIINLVNAGGLGGVGEWRPSAPKSLTGTFGCFSVPDNAEIRPV